MNQSRALKLNTKEYVAGPVVYWMSRDQRVEDNWALLYAQKLATDYKVPLLVVFNLSPYFLGGNQRNYMFKVEGLQSVEKKLTALAIPFWITIDTTDKETSRHILEFCEAHKAGAFVTDFSPLRIQRTWLDSIRTKITVPMYGVDAHNIVPCWISSPKQEFAAYTFRPKIHKLLPTYLEEFPKVKKHKISYTGTIPHIDWKKIMAEREEVASGHVSPFKGGEDEANKHLNHFLQSVLPYYGRDRNDPNLDAQSNLSPYLHYGHISAARIVREVVALVGKPIEIILSDQKNKAKVDIKSELLFENHAAAYLEELIVRRELSDNFCFYNPHYDTVDGFPDWAKKSHATHRKNPREFIYTQKQFEHAKTHDTLWNACQLQMVKTGKMHGYMRMYWAKKILEWTESPESAMRIAIYLNDTYELDGRDPNGYAGIAWSIGGLHDRAWFVRPVYGQIRYMNRNGCKAKFNIDEYIKRWT